MGSASPAWLGRCPKGIYCISCCAGVSVSLVKVSDSTELAVAQSTTSGVFEFDNVPSGAYSLTASHPSWGLAQVRGDASLRRLSVVALEWAHIDRLLLLASSVAVHSVH